jgi:CRP/FNR family transcriptional regulator, cyclic AMP receptor protein
MEHGPQHPIDLLARLPEGERDALLTIAVRRRYTSGDSIFLEGDAADAFFLITAGRVVVRVSTPDGDVVTLTVLGPGDTFGEVALLGGYRRRTASIVAIEAVETLVVNRHDFAALRERQPTIERFLVEVLARQVTRLTTQVKEALYVPVESRLARQLCALAALYRDHGSPALDDVVIPLNQTDLASMAGTSRQTCNRVLRALEVEGVLTLERGKTVITDIIGLRRLAGD